MAGDAVLGRSRRHTRCGSCGVAPDDAGRRGRMAAWPGCRAARHAVAERTRHRPRIERRRHHHRAAIVGGGPGGCAPLCATSLAVFRAVRFRTDAVAGAGQLSGSSDARHHHAHVTDQHRPTVAGDGERL